MRSRPALSVVIPTRNRRRELARTLALLGAQRLPSHEVLVADNGSRDGTASMLRRRFPRVRVLDLGRNRGAEARNVAAAEARGRVLLMLDDDSAPEPGAAARALRYLNRERKLAAVGFRVLLADGSHEPGGTHNVFVGCAAAVRRDLFLAAGGYPADFGYYVEEYALSYRLFAMGYRVRVCGDLVARHRKAGFAGRRADVFGRLVANNLRLAARFLPKRLAAERSREIVRWYLALAAAQGVRGPVAAAARRARTALRRRPVRREPLKGKALEAATGRAALARQLHELRASGVRELGLWRYTKDAVTFIRACRRARLHVRALATDMLEEASRAGVRRVRPREAGPHLLWLVPTFSPGLAENGLAGMQAHGLRGRAFFRYASRRKG